MVGGPGVAAETLTVFAAASLKTALDAAAERWDGDLRISYGGSAALARQIDQGAPADIVWLANRDWMDWLDKRGALGGPAVDVLSNRLVVVGQVAERVALAELPDLLPRTGPRRDWDWLAVGLTNAVPAGIYARQALVSAGVWDEARTRIVEAENVRTALAMAGRGEARYAIVYASDAKVERNLHVVAEIAADQHDPIRYPIAAVDGHNETADAFLSFVRDALVTDLFRAQGFVILDN